MKYLKHFETEAQYEAFKASEEFILPNVTYIVGNENVSFTPDPAFMLRAKYNATPDNLVAFTGANNVKSLKVNGNSIEIEPIKNENTTFDVLGENISLDMETGAATFPESYLAKSPVSSWSFKAKDPNYVINENTYVCMLGMMDGMTLAQPMPLEEAMSFALTTNDGVTLEATNEFLAEMNMQIQSGLQIGFTLCDMDTNSGTFVFIDTEHQTNVTTGGLPTYSFDSEGFYNVEIELSDPVVSMQFAETPLISIEISDGVTTIGSNAFSGCTSLTSVIIPNSVTSIRNEAFSGCSGLTSINIPDSVKTIGSSAFTSCSGLTSVTIGSGVTTIGDHAFYQCSGLTGELVIPDSVIEIGYNAFRDCTGLTSVVLGSGVTTIGAATFMDCSGLTSIVIGSGVTSIDANAFKNCSNLESVYISDIAAWCNISFGGYAQISSNPLYNRCNLYLNNELVTDLIIPDSVTTINDWAFQGCTSLTSVNIPDSVTTINDWAFSSCSGLTSVTLGSGVTEIGSNAFGFCRDLDSITCYAPIAPTIDYTTFQGVSYLYGVSGFLYVPTGSDYSSWMSRDPYYLGYQNWKIQYI